MLCISLVSSADMTSSVKFIITVHALQLTSTWKIIIQRRSECFSLELCAVISIGLSQIVFVSKEKRHGDLCHFPSYLVEPL